MEEEKTKLREALFAFYFEEGEDRIPITSLLKQIQPVGEIWDSLHRILERNVKKYKLLKLDKVKILNNNSSKYLIIKSFPQQYIVIDLETKKSLEKVEVKKIFNEEFFENNFDEDKNSLSDYLFFTCNNVDEVVTFCLVNQNILEMPNKIYCRFDIGEAFTYIGLDLGNNSGQLGFQTPDQTLYDFLHFDLNLNPWGMEYCLEKIGLERKQEMFAKLKDIKIPRSVIPTCFLIEEKTKLREALFAFYFEEDEDRIPIASLIKQLNPIVEVWQNLRTFLEENVTMYDWSSGLDLVKIISYQGNTYLFIKENMWSYIIIDINSKKVLTKEEVTFIFSKEFFVQNLEEEPTLNEDWLDWCYQCRNADKIVEYCLSYEDILKLPNSIVCKYKIKDALTYLQIGLADKSIQLGFQTPDQFLYEFLNLNLDLIPWGMQDAHQRLGMEMMKEMLAKVKEAKIPLSFVPQEFLEENAIMRKLERKEE